MSQTYKAIQESIPKCLAREVMEYNLPKCIVIEGEYDQGLLELTVETELSKLKHNIKCHDSVNDKPLIIPRNVKTIEKILLWIYKC